MNEIATLPLKAVTLRHYVVGHAAAIDYFLQVIRLWWIAIIMLCCACWQALLLLLRWYRYYCHWYWYHYVIANIAADVRATYWCRWWHMITPAYVSPPCRLRFRLRPPLSPRHCFSLFSPLRCHFTAFIASYIQPRRERAFDYVEDGPSAYILAISGHWYFITMILSFIATLSEFFFSHYFHWPLILLLDMPLIHYHYRCCHTYWYYCDSDVTIDATLLPLLFSPSLSLRWYAITITTGCHHW